VHDKVEMMPLALKSQLSVAGRRPVRKLPRSSYPLPHYRETVKEPGQQVAMEQFPATQRHGEDWIISQGIHEPSELIHEPIIPKLIRKPTRM